MNQSELVQRIKASALSAVSKPSATGAASGGVSGALWGSLVGLLFLNPLAGMVLGGAFGAGSGALAGSITDYGIDDDLIKRLAEALPANSSALFLLVRKAQPEKVLEAFKGEHAKVLRSSLSPECQSASKIHPLSASNFDPPGGVDQRLACPALAGVAEGRASAGDDRLRL
jgi:uncharacterized membrane protein